MAHPGPSTNQGRILCLSAEDVERLLMPDPDGAGRLSVSQKLADNYLLSRYGTSEAAIAEQIFRLLVRDTEVAVRAAIADRLKHSHALPHDIVMTMATDAEDAVAVPVLKYSEVLTVEDLLLLIKQTETATRHIAVSERREVPPPLVDGLLDAGGEEVAAALLKNDGAQLDEKSLTAILDRYSQQDSIMRSLARRPGLPLAVAEKVVARVSDSIAQGLRSKYKMGMRAVTDDVEEVREATTLSLLESGGQPGDVQRLVDQLMSAGRLSPRLTLRALAYGYIYFFEAALARRALVSPENGQRLMHDRGDLGFRALYNQASMPPELFGAVRQALFLSQELEKARQPRGAGFLGALAERMRAVSGLPEKLVADWLEMVEENR